MKMSQMIHDLAAQPYKKDFRIQRHILEDEDCQRAKEELAKRLGPHDAGHLLAIIDTVLLYIHEKGMPEDMSDILVRYQLNGGKNRKGTEKLAPEMTASTFARLWGDDDDEESN